MKKKSNLKNQQLKSFLRTSVQQKQPQNDQQFQQFIEDNIVCNICSKQILQKQKKCGFCNYFVCSQHLRKKRKNKGSFDRICDTCEDKYLFESYMKYEMKAEQSKSIQMQIVKMKYETFKDQLNAKNIKYENLKLGRIKMDEKFINEMDNLQLTQKNLIEKQNELKKLEQELKVNEQNILQLQKVTPRPLQDDYKMMQQQSDKLNKDLNKLQKRCQQIKISIQKKQNQLQTQFKNWQNRVSKQQKKLAQQKCLIF